VGDLCRYERVATTFGRLGRDPRDSYHKEEVIMGVAVAEKKWPTQEEIQAEIDKLKEMKPTVRRTSAFGDNHHDAIDAQIEVLEERMPEGQVYDRYSAPGMPENVLDGALDAARWLAGELTDYKTLSEGWQELVR
jgi:hypothetical protein